VSATAKQIRKVKRHEAKGNDFPLLGSDPTQPRELLRLHFRSRKYVTKTKSSKGGTSIEQGYDRDER